MFLDKIFILCQFKKGRKKGISPTSAPKRTFWSFFKKDFKLELWKDASDPVAKSDALFLVILACVSQWLDMDVFSMHFYVFSYIYCCTHQHLLHVSTEPDIILSSRSRCILYWCSDLGQSNRSQLLSTLEVRLCGLHACGTVFHTKTWLVEHASVFLLFTSKVKHFCWTRWEAEVHSVRRFLQKLLNVKTRHQQVS